MSVKKTGLGQGVNLLFPQEDESERYFECEIEKITPNTQQPRMSFEEEGLNELAQSIKEHGVIQPLVVTATENGTYQLIAGERRLRASQRVGLKKIPVIIRNVTNDDSLLELALIENIQRKDLNVIEEAEAYNKLIEKFQYTQEQTAQRVGKKRSTITNTLRLLQLPTYIKADLEQGTISEGHARVLLKLIDNPLELQALRNQIIQKKLSVRQTEKIIRDKTNPKKSTINSPPLFFQSSETSQQYHAALVTRLTNVLQSRVTITQNGDRGKIEIEYYSLDDLERVTNLITREP
ncbi:MAG: ParB/RepB/Spo0J family partition protein [Candidatus Riflebacteria bacterium]